MSTDKYHAYRGDVKAVAPVGESLAFVTVHAEGLPTAVYRLHGEKYTLLDNALPVGGVSLLSAPDGLWIGGTDGHLYHQEVKGGAVSVRGPKLSGPATALAPLANDRLGAAVGSEVVILSRKDGKPLQKLPLPEAVTALASDPTGQWLVAGTGKGNVAVFECEGDPAEFRLSDQAPLHEAAVTALLFEADELRFLSAGADQKLLSTHARGKLEAEDRGRGATHEEPITGMVAITNDRFLTGSLDASLKSWPRAKGARPVTQKDSVAKVVGVAIVPVHGKPQAVAACEDNTLRFFKLDDEFKFEDLVARIYGVTDWAKNELGSNEPKRREAALWKLAEFNDTSSLEVIADQMKSDGDHVLRLLACQLLGASSHPRAAKLLERGLNHKDEAVRVAAFAGMRQQLGTSELRPLTLALKTERADIGQLAVKALSELGLRDDQALAGLVEALDHKAPEVRKAALTGLETVHAPLSPEASLTALGSTHADVRRLALLRLYQRKLLHDPRVQAALRWRGEDADAEVRRVAYLLSLFTRERLVKALRERDKELDRQLTELESGNLPALEEKSSEKAAAVSAPAQAASPAELKAVLAQIDKLGQQGSLPPAFLEQLKKMASNPGAAPSISQMLKARFAGQRVQAPES